MCEFRIKMASQFESKIPSAGNEKRRSLLQAPKSYRRSTESTTPVEPKPPKQSLKEPTHTQTMPTETIVPECGKFKIGDRVTISGVKFGIVQYFGGVHFADGDWCGIELVDPDGKHDGNVGGYQYFSAKPNHGIFAPVQKVELASHAAAFIPRLPKEKSPVTSKAPEPSAAIKTTKLVQPGAFAKSKLKPPDPVSGEKGGDEVKVSELPAQVGKDQEEGTKVQSKLARPKSISRYIQPGTSGTSIPKPGEQTETSEKLQKPTKLPGLFQSKKITPTRTQASSEGWSNAHSSTGIPKPSLKPKQDLNSTFTKSLDDRSEQENVGDGGPNRTFPVTSPTLPSPIPDLLTPNAYRPAELTAGEVTFDQILTEEELADNDLLEGFVKSPVSPEVSVSKDSTELMEKELEQISSLSSQELDIPTPSLLTTTTGSIAESCGSHQELDNIQFPVDPSCLRTSTPERQRAGLSETFTQDTGVTSEELQATDKPEPVPERLSPNSKLVVDPAVSQDLNRTYVLSDNDGVVVRRRHDLVADDTEVVPAGDDVKKERPLSIISTSSVDTGYQPDTDSEMGTLTVNSPSDWSEVPSAPNILQAELMQRSYTESFETYNKAVKGSIKHPAESDSDIFSDGTVVAESETEKEDSELEEDMMLERLKALMPAEESDTESEAEDVAMEEINVKELATPTQESLPEFPMDVDTIPVATVREDEEKLGLEGRDGLEVVTMVTEDADEDNEADDEVDADSLDGDDAEKENICPVVADRSCDVEGSSQNIVIIGDDYDGRGGIMNLSIIDESAEDNIGNDEVGDDVVSEVKVVEDVANSADKDEPMDAEVSAETEVKVESEVTVDTSTKVTDEVSEELGEVTENLSSGVAEVSVADESSEKVNSEKETQESTENSGALISEAKSEGEETKPDTKVKKTESEKAGKTKNGAPVSKKTPKKSPRKSVDVTPPKKPDVTKVRSSLAAYINTPPPPPKPKEKEPETKINKNIINKKKIESKLDVGKTTPPREERKSPIASDKGSPENDPPKIIKRTPVKNKWDDIMSKITENKDKPKAKKEVKSRLDTHMTASPVVKVSKVEKREVNNDSKELTKRRMSAPTVPNYSAVKSKLNTQSRKMSLHPVVKKDNDSRASSVHSSRSDLNNGASDGSTKAKKSDKPANQKLNSLRKKSPSTASLHSDTSQISISTVSQVSTTDSIRSKTDKVNQTKARINQKRQSITEISRHNSPSPSKEAARRHSLGPTSTPRTRPGTKATDAKKSLDKTDNAIPKRTSPKDQKTPRKSSVSQIKGAHQPDLVSNSIGSRAHAAQEISRLEALCEGRTKELNYAKMQLKAGIQGFDAMSIIVQYLTSELDAFSMPDLQKKMAEMQERMQILTTDLDELKEEKVGLETMTHDLIQSHKETSETIKEEHRTQLDALEDRLGVKHEEHIQRLHDQHSEEVKTLKSYHDKQFSALKSEHEAYMQELEQSHSEKLLETGRKHEEHLEELQKQHEAKLHEITHRFEDIKVTLSDKVYTLKAECDELRNRSQMYEQALQRDTDIKVQPGETVQDRLEKLIDEKARLALLPYRDLPQEIESLKAVLDMKNQEIHELRTIKATYEKQLEDLPPAQERIRSLEQKIENLEAIINIKSDYEKQLNEKHHILMRRYDRESKANKRLSMDNEELMWRLTEDAPELLSPGPGKKIPSRSPSNLSEPSGELPGKRSRSPWGGALSPGSEEVATMISKVPMRRPKSRTSETSEKRTSLNANTVEEQTQYYQTL